MLQLILASASPARADTLRRAGIDPLVRVSDVDEAAIIARGLADGPMTSPEQVLALARAKAEDVARLPQAAGRLVLGCDSMFEIGGNLVGKPASAAEARERIAAMAGGSGTLHTGHWLIDRRSDDGEPPAVGAPAATIVRFCAMSAAEIDAYVASGEPLHVAGSFTIDGLGGPFIEGVEGDPHNVVGLSLPTLRSLLTNLDVAITDLWRHASR